MARSLLPAGMVPQSKTAAYDALIGESFNQEAELQNQQNQLVQNLIKDNQGLLKTGYHDWEKYTMKSLDPADPQYKDKLGGAVDYMTRNQIDAPAVTAAATLEFNNTDIQFAQNKDGLGNVIPAGQPNAGDTITNAMQSLNLDVNDPKSYNTGVYNAAEKTAVKNMAKNNPYIRDHSVFKTRFKDMMTKHPVYGQKFKLRIADEAKETYGSVEMDKHSATLATSMGNVAGMSLAKGNTPAEMKAASQTVTKDMNAIFTHMKKFGVSPEQRARIMPSIMQALATTDLVEGSGRRAGFGEARRVLESIYNAEDRAKGLQPNGAARVQAALDGKITVGTQSKLKQALRRIYQDRFKNNIPNKILDQQVDTILNEDKTMSAAMTTGTKDAAEAAKYRENLSTSRRRSREEQAEVLDRMRGYGKEGTPLNVIYNDTLAKLKKDGWAGGLPEDRKKLQTLLDETYRKISGFFSRHNKSPAFPQGDELTPEGREAFLLAARRMFVNNVGVQQEGETARLVGMLEDFSLTRTGKDMDGDDPLMILEKLYENLPLPDRSQPDIKDGLTTFKEKLTNKIDTLRNNAKIAFGPTTDNENQTVGR
jgi:hypothetical protein